MNNNKRVTLQAKNKAKTEKNKFFKFNTICYLLKFSPALQVAT